jgi:hypothetical protein
VAAIAAVTAAGVVALLGLAPSAHARGGESAELRLAKRYVPVLAFKGQSKPCGKGEAYRPAPVELVLGNPDVVLRDRRGRVVKKAPTASFLFGQPETSYLDLPGNPLRPGCTFERDFKRWSAGKPAVTYVHVATEPGEPGKLAVQYWFYYTFNNFNDKHESDWEFAQLVFDAGSVEQALSKPPVEVGISQHEGGERAAWDSDKLEKEGEHPVLYPGSGSHANYYSSALWLGRSAKQGFGCDDTKGPSVRTPLEVRVVPSSVTRASDLNAWLGFAGHWGQKEAAFNNGPPGPQTQNPWLNPITWQDDLRDGAVAIPGGHTLGPSVTSFFCGAVAGGSNAFIFMTTKPWGFLGLALLLLAGTGSAVRRTTWSPPDPRPIRTTRDGGQILRAARRIYSANLRLFVGIGLIFVPLSLVSSGAQAALFRLTGLKDVIAVAGRGNLVSGIGALVVGALGVVIASALVTTAVAAALDELAAGRPVTARGAYRLAIGRLRPLTGAVLGEALIVVILVLTVVGIPLAAYLLVRWAFVSQACAIEKLQPRQALRRSAELVRGRWWRTFGVTATVNVLAALSGPVVGLIALFTLTSASLDAINLIGSIVYVFTIPLAAVAVTLLYFDLGERGASPATRRSLRRPWAVKPAEPTPQVEGS